MKKIFLLFAILTLTILACFSIQINNNITFLNLDLLSQEEYKKFIKTRVETKMDTQLLFGGIPAAYDSTNNEWLFQEKVPEFGIGIDGDFEIAWLETDVFHNIEDSISQNKAFNLVVYNDTEFSIENIKITTLPIVSITIPEFPTNKFVEHKEVNGRWIENGMISFYGSFTENTPEASETYPVNFNIRGSSSTAFDKNSFKINIRDDKNQSFDIALSDTRKDNDWILNSIYGDRSKMREKYITDLWREMLSTQTNPQINGFGMTYIELLINGSHRGLYALTEPIDAKQLEIDRNNDFIIKCTGYPDANTVGQELMTIDSSVIIAPTFECSYSPENKNIDQWKLLGNYFDKLTIDNLTLDEFSKIGDIENQIDFALLKLFGAIMDNDPKNLYRVAKENADGSYIFHTEIWDVNYALGESHSTEIETLFTRPLDPDFQIILTNEMQALLQGDDGEIVIKMIQDRWSYFRNSIFSETEIHEDLDALYFYLLDSGSFLRENDKWGHNIDFNHELSRIKDFTLKRVVLLDAFIANLN